MEILRFTEIMERHQSLVVKSHFAFFFYYKSKSGPLLSKLIGVRNRIVSWAQTQDFSGINTVIQSYIAQDFQVSMGLLL